MLTHMLGETAAAYPQSTALVYGHVRMSYQELYTSIVGVSRGLRSAGVQQGDCIAVILPNCPEFVISFYAAARLHAIVLPLNPMFKESEIAYYLRDGDAKVVITDNKRADLVRQVIAQFDRTIELVVIDGADPQSRAFHDLILPETGEDDIGAPCEGDVLYQYSSGSTGRPKRVSKTQANLFCEIDNFAATTSMNASDTILCIIPMFHTYGVGNCLLPFARTGSKLVILEQVVRDGVILDVPFESRCARVLELIEAEKVTILPAVPYQYSALADTSRDIDVDVSTLRLCFSAGNFLPKDVFDRFMQRFGIPIRQQYGCTEAGSITVNVADALRGEYNAVGLPVRNVELKILDDQLRELPRGQVGNVAIKSPALTRGYDKLPDLNREVFVDGYFVTGDLGRLAQDGLLYITGRKKIFIDTGGHKVDPLELEDLLTTYPKVQEAVVVGVEGPYGGEVIKAVVVPRAPCDEDEIIAYCKERLAEFKIPRFVEFRSAIPKSPLGKILRKDLIQAPESAGQPRQPTRSFRETLLAAAPGEPRRSLLEAHVQQQLAEMLKLEPAQIDPRRPLGDFGLTSIMAVELRNRLSTSLEVSLSVTLVWGRPTIGALVQHLADLVDGVATPAEEPRPAERHAGEELADELAEIEQLSDEEAQQLLADQLLVESETDER